MTAWLPPRVLALDTETTGTDVHNDRIVTASAAVMEGDRPVFTRSWLIAVDVDIPAEATDKHGITTVHAREHGVPAAEAIPQIANAVRYAVQSGMPMVAYNAPFDLSILNAECGRHGLGTLVDLCGGTIGLVIDPLVIDKATDKFRPGKRQLTATCEHFGVVLDNAHDATADAVAAARVALRLADRSGMDADALRNLYADRKYPDNLVRAFHALARMTMPELHAAQVKWFREQSESLGQHWRRQANEARHRADHTEDDTERAVALQEAAELDARVDTLTVDWPITPTTGQDTR